MIASIFFIAVWGPQIAALFVDGRQAPVSETTLARGVLPESAAAK